MHPIAADDEETDAADAPLLMTNVAAVPSQSRARQNGDSNTMLF